MLAAEAARWLKFDGDGSGPLAKDTHPGTRQTAKVEFPAVPVKSPPEQ
jgi:hypothetical protein